MPLATLDSPNPHIADTSRIEASGLLHQEELSEWLLNVEKPIGIIACNDIRALQLLNAARECKIDVPDEVAVVGIDNDSILCNLADPPLSSVEHDTRRIGFEASVLLDKMMRGFTPTEPRDSDRSAARCHPAIERRAGDPRQRGRGRHEIHPRARLRRHLGRRRCRHRAGLAKHAGAAIHQRRRPIHQGGNQQGPHPPHQGAADQHRLQAGRDRQQGRLRSRRIHERAVPGIGRPDARPISERSRRTHRVERSRSESVSTHR